MNLDFLKKLGSLGSLFGKKGKGSPAHALANPSRDWLLLLGGVAVLFTASLGYHLYLFIQVNRAAPPTELVTTPVSPVGISEKEMRATIDALRERENMFNALRNTAPTIPDPSR